ncbi:MAG: glycosyltransferase [Acidobacteriota bacterium]|jgi:glycosyltransferase involved in cell wall biosynthesis|nr:glycosyltransferase [Acidobacteriota bacterium]
MKILFVGYGFHPVNAGGAAQIQSECINACRNLGMEVAIYQSGAFAFSPRTFLKISRLSDGTPLYDLVNSPNRPGQRKPEDEIRHEVVMKISKRVLSLAKPDIVHVHELTFHCADFIRLCGELDIPVVKTIHNYWDLCPQRDLLFNRKTPCVDYDDGRCCVACAFAWRQRPIVAAIWRHLHGRRIFAPTKRIWNLLQVMCSGGQGSRLNPCCVTPDADIDKQHRLASAYRRRRTEFIANLNRVNAIHVYSRKSGKILVDYGVHEDRIHYVPISTRAVDSIARKKPHDGRYPITFGYRGGIAENKGLEILIKAFRSVDQSRARLRIFGNGQQRYLQYLRNQAQGLNIEFMGGYPSKDVGKINLGIDVGIIPSIWEELFGLVGIEFLGSGVPIIASDIGGINEYVIPGKNGYLVKAGDPVDLANAMNALIQDPLGIRRLQGGCEAWISVGEMTRKLGQLYERIVG